MSNSCLVCFSGSLSAFLLRTSVPVHQNLVMKNQNEAINIQKGDLKLLYCKECGFVFNQAFDANKLNYGTLYDNTQELSVVFKEHLESLVNYLIFEKKVKNCHITEVGCGKGGFLKLLIKKKEWGNRGHGFDPTYVGPNEFYDGRLKFETSFFDARASRLPSDVVVCRHVIEHIANPVEFLKLIRKNLALSPHARLFFETPCLKWILKNKVIWDFFYEHCSYFSANSLTRAFEEAGFHVESVGHVFRGQYLWLEATLSSDIKNVAHKRDNQFEKLIKEYVLEEKRLKSAWREQIQALKNNHKIALWGAGAKGVTFANLIDPKRELIECLIDINPGKQNFFTPGTGHPILSYKDAALRGVNLAFMMNSNYMHESQEMLRATDISLELINSG